MSISRWFYGQFDSKTEIVEEVLVTHRECQETIKTLQDIPETEVGELLSVALTYLSAITLDGQMESSHESVLRDLQKIRAQVWAEEEDED